MTMDDADLRVGFATLAGKIDTVIARMEAGDRHSEQLVTLVKDQLNYQAADLGEVKAILRENSIKADEQLAHLASKSEQTINAVRLDLEQQIKRHIEPIEGKVKTVAEQLDEVRLWRAKVAGIAALVGALSSGATAALFKTIGA